MPPTWVRPPLRRAAADPTTRAGSVPSDADAGFFILEALVSITLLALVGAVSMGAVLTVSHSSTASQDRVDADGIAAADVQAARALQFPNYPQAVAARQVQVGTTTYTVTRTVAHPCPTAPNYDTNPFMTVTSTVVWTPVGQRATKTFVLTAELAC